MMTAKTSARTISRAFRCLCVLLAALLLLDAPAFAAGSEPETTQSLAELQDQYKKLEAELKQNEKKLSKVNSEKKAQKKVVSSISDKITETSNQINLLSSRIELLNADISNTNNQISLITGQIRTLDGQITATEAAISEEQSALEDTFEELKERMCAMYMAGSGSVLEVLLTSQNLSSLMTRVELLESAAQQDKDLMAAIESSIGELESLKASLSNSKKQAQGKREELDGKKAALNSKKQEVQASSAKLTVKQSEIKSQYEAANKELNALDKESAQYAALVRQQQKELEKANKQIETRLQKTGSKTTDSKGAVTGSTKMIFPLKCSGVRITDAYGYRTHPITGEYKLHSGTDFTAPNIHQKPIYAVRDGVVKIQESHKAYGNYIVIDHGDGISTLYAHCDSVAVRQGGKVTQGQVIGYVGSTGYATGSHLHFEVRVNGKTTDPMKGYLTLPK